MAMSMAALLTGIPGAQERAYPTSAEEAARQWAHAALNWMVGVVPPSTQVAAAAQQLEGMLVGIFRQQQQPGAPHNSGAQIDAAFQAFGATIALGMLPAYTAIPPPSPPGFAQAALRGSYARTRAEGVQQIASMLQRWAAMGTATLVAPPFTPVVWT